MPGGEEAVDVERTVQRVGEHPLAEGAAGREREGSEKEQPERAGPRQRETRRSQGVPAARKMRRQAPVVSAPSR